jgi:hypothetical protein
MVGWQSGALLAPPVGGWRQRHDPFSQRLCFVFPAWIERLDRLFVEQVVREETPAHLNVQLLWLDKTELRAFEIAYKAWLIQSRIDPGSLTARAARDRLIDLLQIGAPYPLRDLQLVYAHMVGLGMPATITIQAVQAGVSYQLCDEEGDPIAGLRPGCKAISLWVRLSCPHRQSTKTGSLRFWPFERKMLTVGICPIRWRPTWRQPLRSRSGSTRELPVAFQPDQQRKQTVINTGIPSITTTA